MAKIPQDIDRIASNRMGVTPQSSEPPQAAPQAAPKEAPTTDQEKAEKDGSPKTEADKSAEDAVIYKIPIGDQVREMTPQQISATLQRYGALNYQHAQYKPILSAIEKVRQQNPNLSPQQLMDKIGELAQPGEKNTTMGKDAQKNQPPAATQNTSNEDLSEQLKKWEEENAATLPPGYMDIITQGAPQMQAMQRQMAQMQQMMQAVLAQAGGQAQAARDSVQAAQGQKIEATRRQIANNIDRVQAALQIPDERAQDFMTFAAERGYTLEDFIDPELTIRVMQDFRNNMDSPEMERMRAISQRRQAYTGSMGSSPSQASAPAGSPEGTTFDGLAAKVMAQRGMA